MWSTVNVYRRLAAAPTDQPSFKSITGNGPWRRQTAGGFTVKSYDSSAKPLFYTSTAYPLEQVRQKSRIPPFYFGAVDVPPGKATLEAPVIVTIGFEPGGVNVGYQRVQNDRLLAQTHGYIGCSAFRDRNAIRSWLITEHLESY
jgi:hypothetical protein